MGMPHSSTSKKIVSTLPDETIMPCNPDHQERKNNNRIAHHPKKRKLDVASKCPNMASGYHLSTLEI
jgi:hypothetical protein